MYSRELILEWFRTLKPGDKVVVKGRTLLRPHSTLAIAVNDYWVDAEVTACELRDDLRDAGGRSIKVVRVLTAHRYWRIEERHAHEYIRPRSVLDAMMIGVDDESRDRH